MAFEVSERVIVLDNEGAQVGKGTIVNVSYFREPSMKYAINADFYEDDYLFVGEENLKKTQEEIIND